MDRGQMIFFGLAGLFIAYEAFRGWRLGIVRQLIRLGALVSAYLAGIFLGGMAVPVLRLTGYPDLILKPVSMALIGIVAYLIVSFVGRVLFKKTTDQDFGLVWLVYGVTGSLCGVLFGLFFVTMMALAIRFLGTLASGIAEEPNSSAQVPTSKKATVAGLVEMKHALEVGIAGEVLDTVDPIPKKAYELIEKLGRLSANPAAISRFLEYPGAIELTQMKEITALRDDPEIARAVQERRYFSLLKHPRITRTANNPKVAEQVGKFDLEKALDFALEAQRSDVQPAER